MAETYHVLDWRELPLRTAAILAGGLPADSRTCRKLSGVRYRSDTVLMAAILDELRWIVWSKTKAAGKGKKAPKSLLGQMLERQDRKKLTGFDTPEAFEKQRKRIITGDLNG